MRTVLPGIAAAAAALGILVITPLSPGGDAAARQTVTIESGSDYFCDPSFFGRVCETTINAGDTVTWINVQGAHTVTECDASHTVCPPSGGGFDSGILTPGQSFSHTFTSPGSFAYYCEVHPDTMRGRILVVQATPTPAPPTPSPTPVPGGSPGPQPSAPPAATTGPSSVPATGGPPGGSAPLTGAAAVIAGILLVLAAAALAAAWPRRA